MAAKTIKRLEVIMGDDWIAWVVGENGVKSISSGGIITREHETAGKLLTYINLEIAPAYTIGY